VMNSRALLPPPLLLCHAVHRRHGKCRLVCEARGGRGTDRLRWRNACKALDKAVNHGGEALVEGGSTKADTVPDSPLAAWERRTTLRCGLQLRLAPAAHTDLSALVDLLSDAFATSLEAPSFKTYLSRQIFSYLAARLAQPLEQSVLLQATAVEAPHALLGVCELSLSPKTRSFAEDRLTPPQHAVYLCNMTVLPAARRRGIGAALLAAAEQYAAEAVEQALSSPRDPAMLLPGTRDEARALGAWPLEVYLHVNVGDTRAEKLYSSAGYVTVDEHAAWETVLRRRGVRLRLMCKRLRDRRAPEEG